MHSCSRRRGDAAHSAYNALIRRLIRDWFRRWGSTPPHNVTGLGYRGSVTDENLIAEAGRRLAAAAPGARVIVFGSYARGEARSDSDLDLLVIEPEVSKRRAESARLRRELRDLEVALDVIVVSAKHADEWSEVPGTMVNEALQTGRVIVAA